MSSISGVYFTILYMTSHIPSAQSPHVAGDIHIGQCWSKLFVFLGQRCGQFLQPTGQTQNIRRLWGDTTRKVIWEMHSNNKHFLSTYLPHALTWYPPPTPKQTLNTLDLTNFTLPYAVFTSEEGEGGIKWPSFLWSVIIIHLILPFQKTKVCIFFILAN